MNENALLWIVGIGVGVYLLFRNAGAPTAAAPPTQGTAIPYAPMGQTPPMTMQAPRASIPLTLAFGPCSNKPTCPMPAPASGKKWAWDAYAGWYTFDPTQPQPMNISFCPPGSPVLPGCPVNVPMTVS